MYHDVYASLGVSKTFPASIAGFESSAQAEFFTPHRDNRGGVGGANTHRKGSQARDRNLFALYSLQVT